MMNLRRFGLLLDLILLAASLDDGSAQRTIASVFVAMVAILVIFCAVVVAIGLAAQRKPPYPI
jgi:hypothetical protein